MIQLNLSIKSRMQGMEGLLLLSGSLIKRFIQQVVFPGKSLKYSGVLYFWLRTGQKQAGRCWVWDVFAELKRLTQALQHGAHPASAVEVHVKEDQVGKRRVCLKSTVFTVAHGSDWSKFFHCWARQRLFEPGKSLKASLFEAVTSAGNLENQGPSGTQNCSFLVKLPRWIYCEMYPYI